MIADGSPKPPTTDDLPDDVHVDDGAPSGPDALSAVFKQLAEAIEYLAYLLTAQVDRVKLKIRNIVLMVVLGVIGAAAAMALVVCTVWLLLSGVAGGLGELVFGDRPWLGGIVVSVVILLVGAVAGWIAYRRVQSSGLKATRDRYQKRQAEQRTRFGREVEQTAHSPE
jgi:hypothetical protein